MKTFILFLLLTISNVALGGAYPINGGFVYNSTVETTSGTTTTLVATSNQVRIFEGSLFQILKFPNAQLLPADWSYEIVNNSSSFITVRDFDSTEIASVTSGRIGHFQLKSRASQAGLWKYNVQAAPGDFDEYFKKTDHIDSSSGAPDAGKPVVLGPNGQFDLAMIPLGGNGDVAGPAGATDGALAIFDGVTGKLIKEGGPTVDATGNVAAIGFTGDLNGNATTAGAFDHDPEDCTGIEFVNGMAADGKLTCGTPSGGTADVSSNTSSSVDGEVALFSGTGGKTIKRATGSGIAKLTSGVLGTATAGTDYAPATSGSTLLLGNGSGGFSAFSAQTCTNQALTALSSAGAKTCSTITSAYVDTSVAQTGVDINTSHQVTATHLAAGLPINQGGTGQVTKAAAFDALSPMSASGDIVYGGASGTGTRLAKGTDGDVLTLASGIPSWAAPSGGGTSSYKASFYHETDCTWSRTNTSYGDPSPDGTCTFAVRSSPSNTMGTITSANNGTPGQNLPGFVVASFPVSGTVEVCVRFPEQGSAAGNYYNYSLYNGSAIIFQRQSYHSDIDIMSMDLCGLDDVTASGTKTYTIRMSSSAGAATLQSPGATGYTGGVLEWSVKYVPKF